AAIDGPVEARRRSGEEVEISQRIGESGVDEQVAPFRSRGVRSRSQSSRDEDGEPGRDEAEDQKRVALFPAEVFQQVAKRFPPDERSSDEVQQGGDRRGGTRQGGEESREEEGPSRSLVERVMEQREDQRQGAEGLKVRPGMAQSEGRAQSGDRDEERGVGRGEQAPGESPASDQEDELLREEAQMEQGEEVQAGEGRAAAGAEEGVLKLVLKPRLVSADQTGVRDQEHGEAGRQQQHEEEEPARPSPVGVGSESIRRKGGAVNDAAPRGRDPREDGRAGPGGLLGRRGRAATRRRRSGSRRSGADRGSGTARDSTPARASPPCRPGRPVQPGRTDR